MDTMIVTMEIAEITERMWESIAVDTTEDRIDATPPPRLNFVVQHLLGLREAL